MDLIYDPPFQETMKNELLRFLLAIAIGCRLEECSWYKTAP